MEHRNRHAPQHPQLKNTHTDAETFGGLAVAVALSVLGAFLLLSVF